MADYEVLSDVSTTLRQVLADALIGTPHAGTLVEINNLADPVATNPPRLTIFLYELAEDASQRNRPPVRADTGTGVEIRKPPMALLLRYLITAWAGDTATELSLLGRTLQELYDGAIVSGPQLQGGLSGSTDGLKFKLVPLTLEEKARVWYSIQKPYRLSLNYEVRVVNLDSESVEAATPVSTRILDSAIPNGQP